ncbi:MAG: hypothetical protein HYX69_05650 [Planctomycetia bacterium]|nr:hypothetical protein [Planctomycetia bacterium]
MTTVSTDTSQALAAGDRPACKLLVNITHGFQARMLLRSAIAEALLARGASLVVVSASAGEEYFRREFSHPRIALEEMPDRFSRVEAHLITLRQYLLMNPSLGGTLNFKNEAFRRQAPKRYWIARAGNSVLGRITPLRRAYMAAEAKLFGGFECDDILARHKPDLVVTGTPGYNRNDIHLLRAARRLGLPTACVMLSWDNLTSKGYMGGVPDHLLVWSDLMADEAVKYHDYPRNRIRWCGAAQFDHYCGLRERFDRLAWRRQHGVPDGRPLIVYGTINPALIPHEINILRQIVERMRAGAFRTKPYLWVRLHPQVIRGAFSTSLGPFRELAGEDARIEEPAVQSDKLAWDLPKEDAEHLAHLMAAADVVVTPNSTLSIDAACAGTPIINVFFDGQEPIHRELSAERFMHYTHYSQILATGGIAKAMTIDDFVRMADAYVENPDLHREGRETIIRQQLNRLDGQAGVRTAELLWQLATARREEMARAAG